MRVRWLAASIHVELVDDATNHPVVTIRISAGAERLLLMAVPDWQADRLVLRDAHVQPEAGFGPNSIGAAGLRQLAAALMELGNVRELVVEGAVRTTGAGPGHRPRPFRFTRPL